MKAVEKPESRWKSHAFACRRGVVGLIRDLQLRPHFEEPVDRFAFGGADVGGGDDAQLPAGAEIRVQRFFERPQSVPFDERDEEIDAIGGGDLPLNGLPDGRLAVRVDEQIALRQWNERIGRARLAAERVEAMH